MVASNIFYVHPENWGRWIHVDSIFSNELVQPPTTVVLAVSIILRVWRGASVEVIGQVGIQLEQRLVGPVEPCCTVSGEGQSSPPNATVPKKKLGGGFKYFLFSPLPGEMIEFD